MEFNATFLISTISFIIFTLLMNVILYRPLEKIVEEREELIRGNYSDAENANLEAKSLLDKKTEKMAKMKIEAKTIINNKTKEANEKSSKIINVAKKSNVDLINSEKDKLKTESEDIQNKMSEDIFAIAQIISNKLLGRYNNE